MEILVRFAEPFWRAVGQRELAVRFEGSATVADLVDILLTQHPDLAQEFDQASPIIFVDEEEAAAEQLLKEGERVHFVWPIAGG